MPSTAGVVEMAKDEIQMHREILCLLIRDPAAGDAELACVCERHKMSAKAARHISWARGKLKLCIDFYERCQKGGEPPCAMYIYEATAWEIAKDPCLSEQQLRERVLGHKLKRGPPKDPCKRITKDYGPQMRHRLAAIAQLSGERRTEIRAALCRRLG